MTLSSVLDQMAKLPIPQTKEQEEDDVFSIGRCCTDLTGFVRPFVLEAGQNLLNSETQSVHSNKTTSEQDREKEDELQTELLK